MPPAAHQPSGLIGIVDIGSSKVVCVALAPAAEGGLGWAGLGIRAAEGIKCGEITDTAHAEVAIIGAIADAERSAGASLDRVLLGVGCGRLASTQIDLSVPLDPTVVRDEDVRRLRRAASGYAERDQRWSLFEEVVCYRLDGAAHATPPIDRFGRKLEATMTLVTADSKPVGRLVETTERSGLPVVRLTPAPLASAFAVTSEAERLSGITVVDLGAGLMSMVTFAAGRLAKLETLTMGGRQLSQDVAAALQIPFASAERIKTGCANVSSAHVAAAALDKPMHRNGFSSDERHASAGVVTDTRADLCDILSPRLDTMLRHVADHLDASPSGAAGRVVLTGGGSLLNGLPAYAARLLGRHVRLGKPRAIAGLEAASLPAFAAVAGLATMAARSRLAAPTRQQANARVA